MARSRVLAVIGVLAVAAVPVLAAPTAQAAGSTTALAMSARSTATAGSSVSVTVRALDTSGQTASAARDTITFSSSDPAAVLPGSYSFRSRDRGQHAATVTFRTAGAQTLTVAAPGVAPATIQVAVAAATVSRLEVAMAGTATKGVATPFTVLARDAYGNLATGYARAISFTSTDGTAKLPTSYSFGQADAGTHAFAVTFGATGVQTVTARDSRLRATSIGVTVTGSVPVPPSPPVTPPPTTPPPSPPPTSPGQSIAVPAYFWPGAIWTTMVGSAPGVGLAVMNPASGPGASVNPAYVTAVAAAHAAGITVLGYVDSTYATRPLADVEADVARYYAWYGVDGIFFDQASTDCGQASSYYKPLFDYVRSFGSSGHGNTVVLNPGTQTQECFMAVTDIVMNFEGSYATYTSSYSAPTWVATYSAQRFWHIVYGTPLAAVGSTVQLAATRNAGHVYVTDEALAVTAPDVYLFDRLPAPAWWSAELAALAPSTP